MPVSSLSLFRCRSWWCYTCSPPPVSAARTAAQGFAWERRGSAAAPGSPLGLPNLPAKGVPQEAGSAQSRPRLPRRAPVALPFRWSPGAGAGTHSLRTPTPSHSAGGHWGSTVGPSHSPTASSASAVPALVGPVSGPSHFSAARVSSPPNVVSSCSTISACFFSLRVTLAANTAAEATMIASGT